MTLLQHKQIEALAYQPLPERGTQPSRNQMIDAGLEMQLKTVGIGPAGGVQRRPDDGCGRRAIPRPHWPLVDPEFVGTGEFRADELHRLHSFSELLRKYRQVPQKHRDQHRG